MSARPDVVRRLPRVTRNLRRTCATATGSNDHQRPSLSVQTRTASESLARCTRRTLRPGAKDYTLQVARDPHSVTQRHRQPEWQRAGPLTEWASAELELQAAEGQASGPRHSEASHLDGGTGGEAGHPRHQALCSFEGAEILQLRLRACLSYGRRPDSISSAALLGCGWQAAFR